MTERPPSPVTVPPPLPLPRAHKSALGFAFGTLSGLFFFVITAIHVATRADGLPLDLLSQYFTGYKVSWPGAFIGLGWGFAVGFVGGWLLGFVHNFTVSLWMFFVRMRNDLSRTRNFLDHI
jgi:hypothetical protein